MAESNTKPTTTKEAIIRVQRELEDPSAREVVEELTDRWDGEFSTTKGNVYAVRTELNKQEADPDPEPEPTPEPEPVEQDEPDRDLEPARDQPLPGNRTDPEPDDDPDPSSVDLDPGDDRDPEPSPDRDHETDGGAAAEAQGEGLSVGHEGKEKLQPEGAPRDGATAVDPPDGVDLGDASPDDLEPDDTEPAPEPEPEPEPEDTGSGGLLDRIRRDREADASPDDIVEEADTPEERERREEIRDRLEGATTEPAEEPADAEEGEPSDVASGIVMDRELVESMIEMPFNTAAAATGFDGWQLSQREREANARLFVAMCDERGIDVTPTTMFALSMGGTLSGKAIKYRRWRAENGETGGGGGPEPEPEPEPEEPTAEIDADTGSTETETEPEPEGGEPDDFDFSDSSTW